MKTSGVHNLFTIVNLKFKITICVHNIFGPYDS